MIFSLWLLRHRRSLLFLLFSLAIAGIVAGFFMPVTLFPAIDFPRALVTIDSGDQPANQMLLQVTLPVEESLRRVPGLQDIRSTTSRGNAGFIMNFAWGTDMNATTLQINAALDQLISSLPSGTTFNTRRLDTTVFPMLAYSLTSSTISLSNLRNMMFYQLRPLLFSIPGISRINVSGGTQEEFHVSIDPQRLQTYGLSISDVLHALSTANTITAVGKIEDHYQLYLIIADSHLSNQKDIENIIIRSNKHGVVQVDNVADVEVATVPQWQKVTANGQDAVLLEIFQQLTGNSVQIAQQVSAKLQNYLPNLPPGIHFTKWYDQSQLVISAAHSVRNAILIGILLAGLVIWLFLRNIPVTIIAILVVPTSLATTILLLHVLKMSFNIMTLGGMAAAVGLIIDDAIVMIEHIIWRIEKAHISSQDNIFSASIELFQPLIGSSAATVIIFLPLAFLTGVTGAFFKALSITMASALIVSFFVAWLVIPILASHFINVKNLMSTPNHFFNIYHDKYEKWLRHLLIKPRILVFSLILLLIIAAIAYHRTGTGFMPSMDEGGFIIDYKTAPGTALSETNRLLQQIESIINANPDVYTYTRRTGLGFGGADTLLEPNEGDFFVKLKPFPRHSVDDVMDALRQQIQMLVPGVNVEFAQLMEDIIGDLTGVPQPVEIQLYGQNIQALIPIAKQVSIAISKIPGIVDVRDGINPTGDELAIHVDSIKANMEGVDPLFISDSLATYLNGTVITHVYRSDNKNIGVRVWATPNLRATPNDLMNLMLRAPDGHLFPIKRVAQLAQVSGQAQITRDNLIPMIAVTARINNRDLGSVIKEVQKTMIGSNLLPAGVYYNLGGLYQQQQIAFHDLLLVFIAAFGLVFLLQLFLYESFIIVFSIMSLPLLSVSAVFIGLWITGIDLNISAMMGMTMIVGIVTEVAIFYFSEYQRLLKENIPHEQAIIIAGKNRLRPILMTTFAAILTLLPLAVALGQGSSMEQPLAVAIISGLIAQLPLVLLVMPVLFHTLIKAVYRE